jgi:phosphatidylglycerophosphatase A
VARAVNLWRLVAAGFGVGYAPRAPGTFGSLLGLAVGLPLLHAGHLPLRFGCMLVAGLGTYAVSSLAEATQDPGWVVIDEVAGQMIVLLGLPHVGLLGAVLAFGVFRAFDILKPGPVGWLDARHDAYGVMGDDIVAGGLGLMVILVLSALVRL